MVLWHQQDVRPHALLFTCSCRCCRTGMQMSRLRVICCSGAWPLAKGRRISRRPSRMLLNRSLRGTGVQASQAGPGLKACAAQSSKCSKQYTVPGAYRRLICECGVQSEMHAETCSICHRCRPCVSTMAHGDLYKPRRCWHTRSYMSRMRQECGLYTS